MCILGMGNWGINREEVSYGINTFTDRQADRYPAIWFRSFEFELFYSIDKTSQGKNRCPHTEIHLKVGN